MTQNNVPVLGITGNSGSGKNTAGKILQGEGGWEIDADVLAREATRIGEPAYEEIIALFGTDILLANGEIDRRKLGGIVYSDSDLRKRLESVVHRQVTRRAQTILSEQHSLPDSRFMIINAPLLVEADMHLLCGHVWLIRARTELKLARLTVRDGLTLESAQKRLASQMTEEAIYDKLVNSMGAPKVTVIQNDGDIFSLESRVKEALRRFLPQRQ